MSDKLKVLIVEDQPFVAEDLADRLSEHEVLGPFDQGEDVIANGVSPDIALLDIDLKGELDGIQVAEWLNKKRPVPVIFITKIADDSQTFQRVEKLTFPIFYIAKPITQNELKIAVKNAIKVAGHEDAITEQTVENISVLDSKVLIKTPLGVEILNIEEDIVYVEANAETTRVITSSGQVLVVTGYLKVFLEKMSELSNCMVRVSRFHAVNTTKIKRVIDSKHNISKDKQVIMDGVKTPLTLSARYRKELFQRFSSL